MSSRMSHLCHGIGRYFSEFSEFVAYLLMQKRHANYYCGLDTCSHGDGENSISVVNVSQGWSYGSRSNDRKEYIK